MPSSRQDWTPETYLRNAAFVPELGKSVLGLLAPQPGERILDLGCGEGLLSAQIKAIGADILAIDFSPNQVEGAQARGVEATVMDGRELPFKNEFDAVFSNAALHWMAPISKVFEGVAKALKPGGRFVAEMGGSGNVASIRTALYDALQSRGVNPCLHDPWVFPEHNDVKQMLVKAGFKVEKLKTFSRPTDLPGDIEGWLHTFSSSFLKGIDETEHDTLLDEIRQALKPQLLNADGVWVADYVRLQFKAVKS